MGPQLLIKGDTNHAVVFADTDLVEEECQKQIRSFVDHPAFAQSQIRIMPDAHAGMGAVIGFTATLGHLLIPSVVGVDIGCGVSAYRLGTGDIDFAAVDAHIRENVPSGFASRKRPPDRDLMHKVYETCSVKRHDTDTYHQFLLDLDTTCRRIGYDPHKALTSIGTLGGGNHFIEIDCCGESGERYLIIHSGSRNFGLTVAMHHMAEAVRHKGIDYFIRTSGVNDVPSYVRDFFRTTQPGEVGVLDERFRRWVENHAAMCPLKPGPCADNYVFDMKVAQTYAKLNRRLMGVYVLQCLPKALPSPLSMADTASVTEVLDMVVDTVSATADMVSAVEASLGAGSVGQGPMVGIPPSTAHEVVPPTGLHGVGVESAVTARGTTGDAQGSTLLDSDAAVFRGPDIESVHNYIDFDDRIIRKGAIAARKDQPVIIPLNMADGTLLAVGKGNTEWNCSAPHGAGRIMSRTKAFKCLDMEEYRDTMRGRHIYSTCVVEATLDEAPKAYKPADRIMEFVSDTISITHHMVPIYNFKGMGGKWGRRGRRGKGAGRDTAKHPDAYYTQPVTLTSTRGISPIGKEHTDGTLETGSGIGTVGLESEADGCLPFKVSSHKGRTKAQRDRKRRIKKRRRGKGGQRDHSDYILG
ncbi:tRNA-splicing ligase, RtcB [Kipferlia bialata]|uniref:3'-phosphate/5'-hydroxy nucleic acid ligase n=1 Tax=Kipferlia bialata TaxID=797122 RepID=A0A9K3D0R7_9EUKA|nr:tRNA-splicing ligase, RtcB [Kipferlia bialata]|eukprot:g6788.t1